MSEGTIHVQTLMGRRVLDHETHRLGRVYDLEVAHVGDGLCVTALLVGHRAWITRFGWATGEYGKRVPWEQIETLDPVIRLRAGSSYADR
jgi:sporulation protein YlmC with PRC-barrel domain